MQDYDYEQQGYDSAARGFDQSFAPSGVRVPHTYMKLACAKRDRLRYTMARHLWLAGWYRYHYEQS